MTVAEPVSHSVIHNTTQSEHKSLTAYRKQSLLSTISPSAKYAPTFEVLLLISLDIPLIQMALKSALQVLL